MPSLSTALRAAVSAGVPFRLSQMPARCLHIRIEGGRPKGMRLATYEQIWERINDIEELVDRQFLIRLARFGDLRTGN